MMIQRLAALTLLCVVCQTQQISVTMVQPGEDFNMVCSFPENQVGLFHWYRLKTGYTVQKVAGGSFRTVKLEKQFKNLGFTVESKDTQSILNIRNVSKEHEATYFCQAGSVHEMKVINGTLLVVNGDVCPTVLCTDKELHIVLVTLLPYCVFVTAALITSGCRRPVCKQCKGEIPASSQADRHKETEDRLDCEVYSAVVFTMMKKGVKEKDRICAAVKAFGLDR